MSELFTIKRRNRKDARKPRELYILFNSFPDLHSIWKIWILTALLLLSSPSLALWVIVSISSPLPVTGEHRFEFCVYFLIDWYFFKLHELFNNWCKIAEWYDHNATKITVSNNVLVISDDMIVLIFIKWQNCCAQMNVTSLYFYSLLDNNCALKSNTRHSSHMNARGIPLAA